MIDWAAVKPFDPIARQAAVARSEGQGRSDACFSIDAFFADRSARRSLALDRSEHGGRLSACRDGERRAPVRHSISMLSVCALLAFVIPPGRADASCSPPQSRGNIAIASKNDWSAHVREAAKRYDIPEHLIRAVIHVESGGDVRAVSSKGALGLMQIMPATWQELRFKHRLGSNPFDPRDNILAGAAYLREMRDRFGARGFLAAYNAGPQRYDEHLSKGRPLPRETVDYVAKLAPQIKGTAEIAFCLRRTGSRSDAYHSPLFDEAADVASNTKLHRDEGQHSATVTVFAAVRSVGRLSPMRVFAPDLTAIEPSPDIAPPVAGPTPRLGPNDLFIHQFPRTSR
ncbi:MULTISPECIES: lytic transglycosylase domain-containing protein [unclassified Mesorhizobium]|uniref:lytic transglycosylase domain-containing protein n=1 Tax=unclassified Mesorhizobium TaxID=325217 RepID=UPI001FEF075E|nr:MULTISPECIES: lytic transglycosylase domain-containing protein [unclassified Mesorhizobium]